MKNKCKALVVGANGLIGECLLKELLNSPFYNEVEIWIRKPMELSYLKLNKKIIDFDSIDTLDITPVDHVFCCIGTTIKKAKSKEEFRKVDYNYVLKLAEYAVKAGASTFFVISSLGANMNSSNFYLHTKGEMEEAVKNLPLPTVVILQPSLLLGKRKEFRFGEFIAQKIMRTLGFLFVGKLKKYQGIKASTVAHALLKLAGDSRTGKITLNSAEIQKAGAR